MHLMAAREPSRLAERMSRTNGAGANGARTMTAAQLESLLVGMLDQSHAYDASLTARSYRESGIPMGRGVVLVTDQDQVFRISIQED